MTVNVTDVQRRSWVKNLSKVSDQFEWDNKYLSDNSVILTDWDRPVGREFHSVLLGLGLDIFLGSSNIAESRSPIITVHTKLRNVSDIRSRVYFAKNHFPNSAVCFVSGEIVSPTHNSNFGDARGVLCSAGIGFIALCVDQHCAREYV